MTGNAGDRRGLAGLAALAAVGAVALLAFTTSPDPRAGRSADQAQPSPDAAIIEAGRALYVANCASCHGAGGEGGAAGPSLLQSGAAAADFYLRTGRMPLSAPGQRAARNEPVFNEQEIQALVAYVASLGEGPGIPRVEQGGDLQRGWELYTANCAACHAVTGAGNAIGGGAVAVGLAEADPVEIAEATIIGPGAMPVFGFSEEELADLVAYIGWLRTAPSPGGAPIGGTGPVAEGFVGVVIGLPLLVLAALFVARTRHDPTGRTSSAQRVTSARPDEDEPGAPEGGRDR